MSFEAADYSLVFGLDMCSEIWLKVLDLDVLKVVRKDMSWKVVLKQKNSVSFCLKFMIPLLNPLLIKVSCHPCLCIVLVIKPKLFTHLLFESPWSCCFSNNKGLQLLRPVSIWSESVCQPGLFPFNSSLLMIWQALIRCDPGSHQSAYNSKGGVICACIEKASFIHVVYVAQLITMLLD